MVDMPSRVLLCGSVAYDVIMAFPDRFKEHILPDQIHQLNISFMVPKMRREFGGCAGNIAYNLTLLAPGAAVPMATVGHDFIPYAAWLDQQGIERCHITTLEDEFTAQAFITTDLDNNQITAFHPGAMAGAHKNHINGIDNISLAVLSPDGREGMLQHAEELVAAGIPFMFDPGQGTPMFSGEQLQRFITQASWVTANSYEWQLISQRTGLAPEEVAEQVAALIITHGAEGSSIYTEKKHYQIPAVSVSALDPTGCGDAYRAGLLYGLLHELDWELSGRIGALLAAYKIVQHGTQNHHVTLTAFKTRFAAHFGHGF